MTTPGLPSPRANDYRDAWSGDLRSDRVGDQVRVAGWVHRRRDHGGLVFVDLRDRTGLVQVVFNPETAPEAHSAAHALRSEWVISVRGEVVRRSEETVNPDLPTGEIEIRVVAVDVLAEALTPPFQLDEDVAVDEALRLRYRYLDLRREAAAALARAAPPRRRRDARPPRSRRASSSWRRRSSRARHRRAHATSSCRAGCSAAASTRCRSRRSSSSSC